VTKILVLIEGALGQGFLYDSYRSDWVSQHPYILSTNSPSHQQSAFNLDKVLWSRKKINVHLYLYHFLRSH